LPALATLLWLALSGQACQRGGAPGGGEPARGARRNLVLVLADALRASSLSLYGYPRDNAPHLAALARESVVFERHLANYPGTPISVSQMQTGRLMPPLLMSYAYSLAPVRAATPDLLVLPQALRAAGYRTGIVSSHPWFEGAPLLEHFETQALVPPAEGEVYAPFETIAPRATAFLAERARDGEPFFLYVHAMDTHAPLVRHKGFGRFLREKDWPPLLNSYDSAILYTDHWVNELVSQLRAQGLLERTVFALSSDHGEEFAEAGDRWWDRRHGATLRRAQVHVPLLVRLPGAAPGGRRVAGLTRHIDLAPTFLRLALPGASLAPYRLDGSDLSEALGSGAPLPGAPSSLAHSWRYWALHLPDSELIYDQWEDRTSLYRFERDAHNFPVPVKVADAAREAALGRELRREYERRSREFLELPATTSHLARAVVGVPTLLSREDGSSIPTYERDPLDQRWLQEVAMLLQCAPGEAPGPFVAGTPWAPGRYHVAVRFADAYIARGYRNRFRIEFLGGRNAPVQVDGLRGAPARSFDLGVQEIGALMKVRVSEPEGGVAIAGFELSLEGGAPAARAPADDEKLERLRALGYVQ
jgi:arylsulfatase A-like enzyme